MTKYYKRSFLANLIPILTTYILLFGATGDTGAGKIYVWFTLPIWAILYLPYLKLKESSKHSISNKLIIYAPSLITYLLGIILTVIYDGEIDTFLKAYLILILPTFLFNINVDFNLNIGKESKLKDKCLLILKPILLYGILYFFLCCFYTPKFYSENVFSIGKIESNSSLNEIQQFLQDSQNKFSVPNSIKIMPSPEDKDCLDEYDHFLYFKDTPIEVIHIKINSEYVDKPNIEIIGIKNLKEKYKWQWQRRVKKNDPEAIRVLNRIDKTIKEINPKLRTVIKVNEP